MSGVFRSKINSTLAVFSRDKLVSAAGLATTMKIAPSTAWQRLQDLLALDYVHMVSSHEPAMGRGDRNGGKPAVYALTLKGERAYDASHNRAQGRA